MSASLLSSLRNPGHQDGLALFLMYNPYSAIAARRRGTITPALMAPALPEGWDPALEFDPDPLASAASPPFFPSCGLSTAGPPIPQHINIESTSLSSLMHCVCSPARGLNTAIIL